MGEYPKRSEIFAGDEGEPDELSVVEISIDRGKRFEIGFVLTKLTKSETHPHGIKVEIHTGNIGRVRRILGEKEEKEWRFESNKEMMTKVYPKEVESLWETHIYLSNTKDSAISKFFHKSEIHPHEDDKNEFKASFKTPMKPLANSDDEEDAVVENVPENTGTKIKRSVINVVAAIANSEGGRWFIGIDDKTGKVIGSKSGSEMMNLKTNEKYDHYKRAIQDTIFEFTKRRPDNIEFQKGEDEEFLVLHVKRGTEPTYVKEGNKEMYYIRLDGETVSCHGGDMVRHMKKRCSNYLGSNKNNTGGGWNQNRRNYRR